MLTGEPFRYKPRMPDLDRWLPDPALRVFHRRESDADPEALWAAARGVRVREVGRLGRLIRWRIPGTQPEMRFDELFREPPFIVLESDDAGALVSGLVGRIWTLRRDYPLLSGPDEFRAWSTRGTTRVVFGNWVEVSDGRSWLVSEARVEAFGVQGRLGVRAVRPLVRAFHGLIGSEGLEAAVLKAGRGGGPGAGRTGGRGQAAADAPDTTRS
jgi:hypothetical protein